MPGRDAHSGYQTRQTLDAEGSAERRSGTRHNQSEISIASTHHLVESTDAFLDMGV